MAGRQDYNTPSKLVKQYYKELDAPIKEFHWFEDSAHDPHFEEPEKFYQLMRCILNETYLNLPIKTPVSPVSRTL